MNRNGIYIDENYHTLSGSQIEVKVNNVSAGVIASWRAKLGHEVRLEKTIRGNPNRLPINTACLNALVGLYVFRHPLHHHFRRPALVLRASISLRRCLQQTPLPRRCYRKCTHILW